MSGHRMHLGLIGLLVVALIFSACSTPTPQAANPPIVQTVVVEKPVIQTVVVEKEKTVETIVTPTPEKVNLQVWYLSGSPEELKLVEDYSNKFAAKHPGVTVTISPYGYDDMNKTLKLALDSGTGPDVAYCSPGTVGHIAYAKAGHLVELTSTVKDRGWDQRQPMDQIMYWQKELGGPIYGIPYDLTTVGVFYNKDLFDKWGYKPATTFEEFQTLIGAVKSKGVTPFPAGGLDGWPFDHYFMSLVHVTTPIDQIEAINYSKPTGNWASPGFIQAATILDDWVKKGYFNDKFMASTADDQSNLFMTGKTAMDIAGTWNNFTFLQQAGFKVGFFPLPRVNPDIAWHSMITPNNVWVIPKYTKHQELAIDYLDYMLSSEVATALWNSGDIPTFRFATLPQPKSDLQKDVYQSLIDTGIGYYFSTIPEVDSVHINALQSMAAGDLTPKDAMEKIQAAYVKATSGK
jgi:raffinose/stachyose/melibiose transport system substrate-binding protein